MFVQSVAPTLQIKSLVISSVMCLSSGCCVCVCARVCVSGEYSCSGVVFLSPAHTGLQGGETEAPPQRL